MYLLHAVLNLSGILTLKKCCYRLSLAPSPLEGMGAEAASRGFYTKSACWSPQEHSGKCGAVMSSAIECWGGLQGEISVQAGVTIKTPHPTPPEEVHSEGIS